MTIIPNIIASHPSPLFLSHSTEAADGAEIDLSIPQQILDNWCWAAVTAGLEAAFGIDPARSQCRIVSDVLGTGCCPDGANVQNCNIPHAPQPALGELFDVRVDAPVGTSLPFLRREIGERRLPVLANLGFSDGRIGHLVVISGFRRTGSLITLTVWDPYTGERSDEPLNRFRRAFRDNGMWRASYRLKRVTPIAPH